MAGAVSKIGQDHRLMRWEGIWSIVFEARWSDFLGNRNQAGHLPQLQHLLLVQVQVEEVLQNSRQLAGTGPLNLVVDTVLARSIALVESLQLSPILARRHSQVGEGACHLNGGTALQRCRVWVQGAHPEKIMGGGVKALGAVGCVEVYI